MVWFLVYSEGKWFRTSLSSIKGITASSCAFKLLKGQGAAVDLSGASVTSSIRRLRPTVLISTFLSSGAAKQMSKIGARRSSEVYISGQSAVFFHTRISWQPDHMHRIETPFFSNRTEVSFSTWQEVPGIKCQRCMWGAVWRLPLFHLIPYNKSPGSME